MNKPEILAPGGSKEAVYAAIAAGCDAVYMGGKRFGARAFADNPDNDDLLEIMDIIHMNGKKICPYPPEENISYCQYNTY